MAFVVKDRVKETTTTTGTSDLVLSGSVSGFQSFSNALADGDTTYYALFEVSTNEWEVGVGTWTESTTTLARTTVLASSNSGSKVSLTAQAEVFISQPAGKAAFFDPSGDLTLVQDPTSNLQAATKQYVDTIAAAGLHYHDPVRVEQEGNLSATYSNGTAGVGATLTNNSTQAALTIDGVALSLNDRVLIYEQTNGYENGVYTVTNVGSASTNWVLTRATDADSYGPSDPDSLGQGDAFFVLEGTAGAGELYVMNTEGTITFGTTNITFTQVAATAVYTAGTGLTLTGTEFAAAQDISTTASPSFAGITVGDGHTIGDDVGDNLTLTSSAGENIIYNSAAGTHAFKSNGTSTVTFDSSGNITVTGNVDGRDIAADGSKLDGIESGATADQTASEILTAIKTVDGTGSGLDADTVDGIQASSFLRSDAADTATGLITFSGTSSAPFRLYASNAVTDWDAVTFQATTEWGDSNNYGVLGGDGSEGIMFRKPHVVWNSSQASADIRLGRSGGTSSGAWVNFGVKASNTGFIGYEDNNVLTFSNTGVSIPGTLNTTGQLTVDNDSGVKVVYGTETTNVFYAGYGIDSQRDTTYIRPLNDNTQTLYIGNYNDTLDWNTIAMKVGDGDNVTINNNKVFHAGNDGSGSGLDADTTDGYQASESNTASTLVARTSGGDIGVRYVYSDYLHMGHTLSQRNSDSVFFSSYDGFIRKNNATGFKNSLGLGTGDGPTFSSVTVADALYHSGDGDTYVSFGNDLLALTTGGTARVYVSNTGVQLGDTGNGYFRPVSGSYGSIEIDGGAHGGYEGYGIGGVAVFMTDSANYAGLYNDANNQWWFRGNYNGSARVYYQGVEKFRTDSTGCTVQGTLSATSKSFVIGHPTKEGMKLRHGSLEGPEDGVYVRGRLTSETVIELPDYWTGLVHEDSITVQLTAMGNKADLWVESIADNKVTVGCDTEVDCFYFVQATRKDVDAWDVEYVADS